MMGFVNERHRGRRGKRCHSSLTGPAKGGLIGSRLFMLSLLVAILGQGAFAQQLPQQQSSEAQQWRRLFSEDLAAVKRKRAAARKKALKADKPAEEAVGVSAPKVDYSADGKTVSASGGVVVSRSGIQVEADEAHVDLASKEAAFDGGVLVSTAQGSLAAKKGLVDLDTEVAVFEGLGFSYDEGGYRIDADKAVKLSDTEYELTSAKLTTCDCRRGDVPWSLYGRRVSITQGGYAHTSGMSLRFGGVPVMYAPYFIFPVKTERAAGMLVPLAGLSQRDGFRYWQPIFLPLDGSTDLTVTPFVETESRYGSTFKVRKELSLRNSLRSKLIYSNESAREGSLRGLRVPDGIVPDIDTHRIGFMYGQNWRTAEDALIPSSFAADIRYTSDDEFLREIQDADIGLATTIFQSSSVLFQSMLGSSVTASLGAEYNQAIDFDIKRSDETIFQRLPEASLAGSYSLYPFGSNPLGLKLLLGGAGTVTSFTRELGYDGTRTHIAPTITVPFHLKNYVFGSVALSGYDTYYALNEVGANSPFSSSESRRTAAIQYTMGTALEKTEKVAPDSLWRFLTGLGTESGANALTKVKHTIEPIFRYTYVPDVDQDNLPLFDSVDRIRQRSLFTAGFDSSFFGKFEPRDATATAIPELVPRPDDLPELGFEEGIPLMFGDETSGARYRPRTGRRADVRELVSLSVRQSYDYAEEQNDLDPTLRPFSDIWVAAGVNPTNYLTASAFSNVSPYTGSLTSWGTVLAARDDRGDRISGTYSFNGANQERIDQVVGNAEVVLTDRLKVGYFNRYDIVRGQSIEQAVALRFVSACNCWHVDVGMSQSVNPDNQRINVRFALTGLGDLTQGYMFRNPAMMGQQQ